MIPRITAIFHPGMSLPSTEDRSQRQEYVRSLFDGIAQRYDFLNHLLSAGIDILWRKQAIRLLKKHHPELVLDVATGTGDLAIEAARTLGATVKGIDLSGKMLGLGRQKIRRAGLETQVTLGLGSAEALEFDENTFDAVTVAFGVRNFADLRQGLSEMYRVLKANGIVLVLEFSRPHLFPFNQIYGFYFWKILPILGGFVSRSRSSYEYLPRSVMEFPDGKQFLDVLNSIGFSKTENYQLTLGIATIYLGTKEPPYPT